MAVRKKVRTVTVLSHHGCEYESEMTTTALYGLKRVNVMVAGKRLQMYFTRTCFMGALHSLGLSPLNFNTHATDLYHPDEGREVIVGDAFLVDPTKPWRYVRVVSIKPVKPFGSPGCIRETFRAFEEWSLEQFDDHPPYPLYDQRGLYVACEHPDPIIRDRCLTMSRLKWG